MLRPNGHRGKVLASHRLLVPNCAVYAAQAWGGARDVSAMPAGCSGPLVSSGQVQPGVKDLHRRCRLGAVAVLDAIPALDSGHDPAPTPDGPSAARGDGRDGWGVDQAQAKAGVGWVNMRGSLAATGTCVPPPGSCSTARGSSPRTRRRRKLGACGTGTRPGRRAAATGRAITSSRRDSASTIRHGDGCTR